MTDEERKAQEAEEAKALAKKKAEESGEFNEAQQAKANLCRKTGNQPFKL